MFFHFMQISMAQIADHRIFLSIYNHKIFIKNILHSKIVDDFKEFFPS